MTIHKKDRFEVFKSKDLFTGETIYIYENTRTHEIVTSTRDDLLDELNRKDKITIVAKEMTFKFKKK